MKRENNEAKRNRLKTLWAKQQQNQKRYLSSDIAYRKQTLWSNQMKKQCYGTKKQKPKNQGHFRTNSSRGQKNIQTTQNFDNLSQTRHRTPSKSHEHKQ